MSSCQIFLAAIKSHFSANELLLNILIGLLLEEPSIILQVIRSIVKGQTSIIHILLLKSEQRMSQKVAEPRPNFQKGFPDKKVTPGTLQVPLISNSKISVCSS